MPAPPIRGVVESCIYSDNLPASVRFYEGALGLRLIECEEHLCAFAVGAHQVFLVFLRGHMVEPVRMEGGVIPPHDSTGQSHFAFSIAKEDFPAWEKRLADQGIAIESRVDWPAGGKSLYFRDPDGNLAELATPGIWEVY